MRKLGILILMLLVAGALQAAVTETSARGVVRGHRIYLSEDTSAANAAIILTTKAGNRARALRCIQVVCSASATVTITSKITRTITSGAVDILLPDITITASTSGALYVEIHLMPTDVVAVTVPAAGAGITCSPMVIEETE